MSRNTKFLLVVILAIAVIGLIWAFLGSRKEAREEEGEKPSTAPSRVAAQNGRVLVTMKPEEQQKNGIRTASLNLTSRKQELQATAVVLPVQDLISLRNGYVAATAQLQKAQASLNVSLREYERLNALYKHEHNASMKALQAAQGAMLADQVTVKSAEDAIFLGQNSIRQQWGDVVARWLFDGSLPFYRLVRQRDVLLQVVSPPGEQTTVPASVSLQTTEGSLLKARLISPFPRLDPRIQSPSFLYRTRNQPGLIPGLNLAALLPSGPVLQGVVVPSNAVVWWEGKAWAYVQLSADQFSRQEVPTRLPVTQGWFVPITNIPNPLFRPGEGLVINGAQQLLSEEFRSQIQTGETD